MMTLLMTSIDEECLSKIVIRGANSNINFPSQERNSTSPYHHLPYILKENPLAFTIFTIFQFASLVIYLSNLSVNILEMLIMCTHVGNEGFMCLFPSDALSVIMCMRIENDILSDLLAKIMCVCNKI